MAVIAKKDEKIEAVFSAMVNKDDYEEFRKVFVQMYPEDWGRIQKTYAKEERRDKKGKGHPMPKPEVYVRNMFNVASAKRKRLNENS